MAPSKNKPAKEKPEMLRRRRNKTVTAPAAKPSTSKTWDDTYHRCAPGLDEIDEACNAHREHHWCDACEGFYGVPHNVGGCHTMQQQRRTLPSGTDRKSVV